MLGRGAQPPGPVRPRFRCRACQAFVTGTELGHCPRCGVAAPIVVLLQPNDDDDHDDAVADAPRAVRPSLAVLGLLGLLATGAWLVLR